VSEEVFQDEVVRATDLNRGSGEVLNKASRGPVTIIRNDEAFALMRRELAAHWKREASSAMHIMEIVTNALMPDRELAPEYRWISAFDRDEATQMADDLVSAYRKAVRDSDWNEFDAVLHEWSESGWAALSPDIEAAFRAPEEKLEIPDPTKAAPVDE
jgi:hypothetical protein